MHVNPTPSFVYGNQISLLCKQCFDLDNINIRVEYLSQYADYYISEVGKSFWYFLLAAFKQVFQSLGYIQA